MLCGFFAGILVCIRYAGMSLLVATALFLICNLLWHNWQEVRRWLLQWLVGAVFGPFLLFARNLAAFGKVLPQNLQPMSMSNLNQAFSNQIIRQSLWEMFLWYKWPSFAKFIFVSTVVALFLYLTFICFQKRPREIRSLLNAHCNLLFLSLYVLIYFVSVVFVSSGNFLWGEQGRFGLQVFWILWLYVVLFLYWFLTKLRMRQGGVDVVILFILTILTGIHFWNSQGLARLISSEGHRNRLDSRVIHYLKKNVPPHKVILTCSPSLIRVDCDLNAQPFLRRESFGKGWLKIHDIVRAGEKGLLWCIVIRNNQDEPVMGKRAKGIYELLLYPDDPGDMERVHNGTYGPHVPLVIANPEKYGFVRIRLDVPLTILKFNPVQEDMNGNGIGNACEPSQLEYHWLEAEHANSIVSPLGIAYEEKASGGKYIYSPNVTENQYTPSPIMAIYTVDLSQAGEYILWGRVKAFDTKSDSFFIQIDDGFNNLWDIEPGDQWHWNLVNDRDREYPVKFILNKGNHTIKIKLREDGTKLDKMVLTNNITFKPTNQMNLDDVISEYKKELAINPNNLKARHNVATAYLAKGMLDEAISEYKNILALNPNYAKSLANLGLAYYQKGMLQEAIEEYKKAITTNPNSGEVYYNLSIVYYDKQDYKLAILHCDRAQELGFEVPSQLLSVLKPYR